ncbi:MAG: ThuA domain-containing protein [Planctomycetota bacterium]|jgi:type 1 glutamine amidotransferase
MKTEKNFGLIMILTVALLLCSCAKETVNIYAQSSAVKVAVITGGHDFDEEEFFEMFDSFQDVEYVHLPQKDHSEVFEDISDWPYDAVVLYNMSQEISPKRQRNFINLLNNGVGLVALHHSIAAFQEWTEYRKIIGARYFLSDVVENGITYKRSIYKHDVTFTVNVEDKSHPITRALGDFSVNDETYKGYLVDPDNILLLSTEEPSNNKYICWTRKYGNSKICYIQLGHGFQAYNNKNYRTLVANAIKWSADRLN